VSDVTQMTLKDLAAAIKRRKVSSLASVLPQLHIGVNS